MQCEKSRWNSYNLGSSDATDLLENCVNRKTHLEKILFAYHNLHNLHPWYSESVQNAFETQDPLALWNFENVVILNSRDVDNLMNQQGMSFAPPDHYEPPPQNVIFSVDMNNQPPNAPYPMQPMFPPNLHNGPQFVPQVYHQPPPIYPPDFSVPPPPMPMPCPSMSCTPVPSEYSNSMPYEPSLPDAELVYDVNGVVYKRVMVTSTCLVPVSSMLSSASSSYSTSSMQSEPPQRYESAYAENPNRIHVEEQTSPAAPRQAVNEPVQAGNETVEGNTMEVENISSESMGSVEILSPQQDVESVGEEVDVEVLDEEVAEVPEMDRPDTPISDILKYITFTEENAWEQVQNKKRSYPPAPSHPHPHPPQHTLLTNPANEANYLPAPLSTSPSLSPIVNQTVVVQETEEGTQLPDKSSSSGKQKLTKKEKRLLAAENAKRLETDDVILEAALKANRDLEALAVHCDAQVTSVHDDDKKKKRFKDKLIVESVTVSKPQPPAINPHILHAVKMAVLNRAEDLRRNGRALESEHPIRHEYLQKMAAFEDNRHFERKDSYIAKKFIKLRIQAFQEIPQPQSLSRITIYEQLYVGLPRVFIPELCFLNSLLSEPEFPTYEEVFFSMF